MKTFKKYTYHYTGSDYLSYRQIEILIYMYTDIHVFIYMYLWCRKNWCDGTAYNFYYVSHRLPVRLSVYTWETCKLDSLRLSKASAHSDKITMQSKLAHTP